MKFYLNKVKINNQGYDYTGYYWGIGKPLYFYENENCDIASHIRANDREDAKNKVKEIHPDAIFFR